jgi:pyruvate,water dikinase
MSIDLPSNVVLLEKFIAAGIDGLSIDSHDLSALILGVDPKNSELERVYNEENEAVLWAIERVIKIAHKYHIPSSLHGHAIESSSKLLESVITWGITSVSVAPSETETIRERITEIEKRVVV